MMAVCRKKSAWGGIIQLKHFCENILKYVQLINLLMSKPVSCIIEKKKIMMFPQCHPSLISNHILSTEYAPELASGIKICQ